MTHWFNVAAVLPLVIGMILLKRTWVRGTARGSFITAISALVLSVVLFCFGLGVALGLIVGISMVGIAGIATSAASADLGRPRLLSRSSPQAASGRSVRQVLAGTWRSLLVGPVALCAGLAFGLVTLSTLPGADADRLVACTLAAIVGSALLIGWSCSDARLRRATLTAGAALMVAATAALVLGAQS